MIELINPTLVESDDSELEKFGHIKRPRQRALERLAIHLELDEVQIKSSLCSSPLVLLKIVESRYFSQTSHNPLVYLLYSRCLTDELLDVVLEFARSRKSFGKALLSHQAVSLRVASVFLASLSIEQALDDWDSMWATSSKDENLAHRLTYVAKLTLDALRNTAQVLAGHGYVDNHGFDELHTAALKTVQHLAKDGYLCLD
jgi:hypothetical protein